MTTRRPAERVPVVRAGASSRTFDEVITEEPLQIRVDDVDLAVTMRTPGHDFELAIGFLVGEGVVRGTDDVVDVRYCVGPDATQEYNVVTVGLRAPVAAAARAGGGRATAMTSACGLCGKRSIDEVHVACSSLPATAPVPRSLLVGLPAVMRTHQSLFSRTGGVHAAGLFTRGGDVVVVREDVGRHNAVDKVVGRCLLDRRLPLHDHVLVLSGRASFEMVQKAALAGVTTVVAVSAPSWLAVSAASQLGVALVAFGGNVYAGLDRIALDE